MLHDHVRKLIDRRDSRFDEPLREVIHRMLRVGETEYPLTAEGVLEAAADRPVQLVDTEIDGRYLFARSLDRGLWSVPIDRKADLVKTLRPLIGRLLTPKAKLAERLEWLEPAAYVDRMVEPLPVTELEGEPVTHGFPIELLRCLGASPLEYLPIVARFLNRCVVIAEEGDPMTRFDDWLPSGEEIDRAIAFWIRKRAPKGRLKVVLPSIGTSTGTPTEEAIASTTEESG